MQVSKRNSKFVKWLNGQVRDSNNIYTDPGYGHHYKSMYGLCCDENDEKSFYKSGDIDHQHVIGSDKLIDDDISEYIDRINDDVNLLIPPGSNQSNANYMYKLLKSSAYKVEYEIPYVSANPTVPYTGYHKCTGLKINKKDFYNFVHSSSIQ